MIGYLQEHNYQFKLNESLKVKGVIFVNNLCPQKRIIVEID